MKFVATVTLLVVLFADTALAGRRWAGNQGKPEDNKGGNILKGADPKVGDGVPDFVTPPLKNGRAKASSKEEKEKRSKNLEKLSSWAPTFG